MSRSARARSRAQQSRPRRPARVLILVLVGLILAGAAAAVVAPAVTTRVWQSIQAAAMRLFGDFDPTARHVEALAGEPAGLNPLLDLDPASQQVTSLLFWGLTTLDGAGNVQPGLATDWSAAPGNRTWTFSVRRDCVWHDGQPLTARDVTFTINSLASADFPGDLRGMWQGASARYTNDYTVIVDLPAADAVFPVRAAVAILPRHILSSVPFVDWYDNDFARNPVGSGPYVFREWQAGREIVLAANQRFFLGAPSIAEVAVRFSPAGGQGTGVAAGAFEGGNAATAGIVAPASAVAVGKLRGLAVLRYPSAVFCALVPNHRGIAGERAVRLAMQAALDLDRLVEAVTDMSAAGGGSGIAPGSLLVVGGPFVPGSSAAVTQVMEPRRDLPAARKALADAGWADGDGDGVVERGGVPLRLSLAIPAGRPDLAAAAAELARQLRECGIAVEPGAVSLTEYLARWAPPFAFDLLLVEWASQPGDDLYELLHSSQQPVRGPGGVLRGGANIGGFGDPQADTILEGLRATPLTDGAARGELYAALCARWRAEAPQIALWRLAGFYGHPDRLEGPQPGPYGVYWNVHTWSWR